MMNQEAREGSPRGSPPGQSEAVIYIRRISCGLISVTGLGSKKIFVPLAPISQHSGRVFRTGASEAAVTQPREGDREGERGV